MRTKYQSIAMVAAVVVLGVLVSQIFAAPPQLSDPPTKDEIDARIQHWADQIATGETVEDVFKAAENIIYDLRRYRDQEKYPDAQSQLAGAAAAEVSRVLAAMSDDDELRAVREINAARTLARAQQLAVRSTLDELIAHPNAGVRYYGWLGYAGIRTLVMQSPGMLDKLVASLTQQAAAETSGVAAEALCRVLALPKRRPVEIGDDAAYKAVADRFMAAAQSNWLAWVRLASEDEAWADALTEGVGALSNLSVVLALGDDDETKGQVFQDLVDALSAGAVLYRSALESIARADELAAQAATAAQEGNSQKAEQLALEGTRLKARATRMKAAAAGLLMACEGTLNELTGENFDHIKLPMGGKRRKPVGGQVIVVDIGSLSMQADAVQLGAIAWAKQLGIKLSDITSQD